MPSQVSTPFGTRYEPDAFDESDRYNADRAQRFSSMALGLLNDRYKTGLGYAQLGTQRDLAQAGINMQGLGLQSAERMHSADLGFAGKGLQFQSDALKQQLDLERGRDTTQQGNYQQMLQMGAPMRDASIEEMKGRMALESLQRQQLEGQLKAQTAAQQGAAMPTNLSDFERSNYTADIAAGMNPAGASADIQGKRHEKSKAAADALASNLGARTGRLASRDANWFFDKPTDAEGGGIVQGYQDLVRKYQESGMDRDAAVAQAKSVVMANAPQTFFRPHVRAIYESLGMR